MKYPFIKILSILLMILCVFPLSSCDTSYPAERGFFAMDTHMTLKLNGKGAQEAANAIESGAESFEQLFSVTITDSDISRLNASPDEAIPVSEATMDILEQSIGLCENLNGYLDISLYPISKLWGFTTEDYRIPKEEEIDRLLPAVGYRNIELDKDLGTVTVKGGAELDLGAVAKGYLADSAQKIFKENGSIGGICNLGGTVVTAGVKENGELWKVGVAEPEDSSSYFGYLLCTDTVIATSGGYERYFIGDDQKRYCHIIDPKTGVPVNNGVLSVTIVCDSGIACDALSTALFVMGQKKAEEFYRDDTKYHFEYIMLTEDNTLYISSGLKESFSLTDERSGYQIEYIT